MEDVTAPVEDLTPGPAAEAVSEYRTSQRPCVTCLTTMALDDGRSALGTVRWRLSPYFGLQRGTAVEFRCPQGHSSDTDPELLTAFPSRTFDVVRAMPRPHAEF